jgi:hypothetical protein
VYVARALNWLLKVTAYNPNGGFTNAGNDWYFENRIASPQDASFMQLVSQGGSKSIFTIPAYVSCRFSLHVRRLRSIYRLDWVSKDATSYSYSRSVYPSEYARQFGPARVTVP